MVLSFTVKRRFNFRFRKRSSSIKPVSIMRSLNYLNYAFRTVNSFIDQTMNDHIEDGLIIQQINHRVISLDIYQYKFFNYYVIMLCIFYE